MSDTLIDMALGAALGALIIFVVLAVLAFDRGDDE